MTSATRQASSRLSPSIPIHIKNPASSWSGIVDMNFFVKPPLGRRRVWSLDEERVVYCGKRVASLARGVFWVLLLLPVALGGMKWKSGMLRVVSRWWKRVMERHNATHLSWASVRYVESIAVTNKTDLKANSSMNLIIAETKASFCVLKTKKR